MDHRKSCTSCEGAGEIEVSEDRLDSRGEHYTREHMETCDRCGGEGGTWVDVEITTVRAAARVPFVRGVALVRGTPEPTPPTVAELDAWGAEQLDALVRVVDFYPLRAA